MKRLFLIVAMAAILSGCIAGGTGNYRVSLQSKRITSINATQGPVRYGETAQRFEVREGDCGSNGSWNDCTKDRERSELLGPAHYGGPHWYAWSIYLPEDYPNIYPTKTALGQFHLAGNGVSVMFQNQSWYGRGGGLWVDRFVSSQSSIQDEIISEEDLRGKWHDILVKAVWSKGDDGEFTVWVNGVEKYTYKGFTSLNGSSVSHKYGIYRSFVSRYKFMNGDDVPVPTQVVYYDEVRYGRTRAEVDIRMIEKQSIASTE